MNKSIIAMAIVAAAAGSLAADEMKPQWLLNVDGVFDVNTAPKSMSGDTAAGAKLGAEWVPAAIEGQTWGFDLDYNYLTVGKSPENGSDDNIDLSVRWLPATFGITTLTLQAGIGTDLSSTKYVGEGHYVGFLEPGVRVVVAPKVAIDAGVDYLAQTPFKTLASNIGVTVGVSIPLDGVFSVPSKMASSDMAPAAAPAAAASPAATPAAAPAAK